MHRCPMARRPKSHKDTEVFVVHILYLPRCLCYAKLIVVLGAQNQPMLLINLFYIKKDNSSISFEIPGCYHLVHARPDAIPFL